LVLELREQFEMNDRIYAYMKEEENYVDLELKGIP